MEPIIIIIIMNNDNNDIMIASLSQQGPRPSSVPWRRRLTRTQHPASLCPARLRRPRRP